MNGSNITQGYTYNERICFITAGVSVVHDWMPVDDDERIGCTVSVSVRAERRDGTEEYVRVTVTPEMAEQIAGDLILSARDARVERDRLAELDRKAVSARLLGSAS